MAELSAIEWTDSTFNPWMGCTKVSPACDHCYAEALMDTRYGKVQWGPHGERKRTSAQSWNEPRRWQKKAAEFFAEHGRRRRVFCASLADVFDNKAPEGARNDLWTLIRETPDLDWLLLTKRPQNIAKMLPEFWGEISNHVWLGTSTENQDEANRRLPHLLDIKPRPAVFFASAEPLLGDIDFRHIEFGEGWLNALEARAWADEIEQWRGTSETWEDDFLDWFDLTDMPTGMMYHALDWIITGGESGSGARPMHPDWVRSIRDQCAAAGTAYLHKQWGEWLDEQLATSLHMAPGPEMFDRFGQPKGDRWHPYEASDRNGGMMIRVGKKAAGRLLDGVTHDGFPEPHR